MEIDYDYFSPASTDIALYKKLIKKQGELVCRDQIYVDIISKSLRQHSFGVLAKTRQASTGRNSPISDDKWSLLGFATCEPFDDDMDTVILSLICARKNQKEMGKDLMGIIEDQARQLGYKKIQLFSLPEPHLIRWYERLGYKKGYVIPDYKTGTNKLVTMTKKIF